MDLKFESGQEIHNLNVSIMGPTSYQPRLGDPSPQILVSWRRPCSSKLGCFIVAVRHTRALNEPHSYPCADNTFGPSVFFSNRTLSGDIVRAGASPLVNPEHEHNMGAYRIVGVQNGVPMCPYVCTLGIIVSIR